MHQEDRVNFAFEYWSENKKKKVKTYIGRKKEKKRTFPSDYATLREREGDILLRKRKRS